MPKRKKTSLKLKNKRSKKKYKLEDDANAVDADADAALSESENEEDVSEYEPSSGAEGSDEVDSDEDSDNESTAKRKRKREQKSDFEKIKAVIEEDLAGLYILRARKFGFDVINQNSLELYKSFITNYIAIQKTDLDKFKTLCSLVLGKNSINGFNTKAHLYKLIEENKWDYITFVMKVLHELLSKNTKKKYALENLLAFISRTILSTCELEAYEKFVSTYKVNHKLKFNIVSLKTIKRSGIISLIVNTILGETVWSRRSENKYHFNNDNNTCNVITHFEEIMKIITICFQDLDCKMTKEIFENLLLCRSKTILKIDNCIKLLAIAESKLPAEARNDILTFALEQRLDKKIVHFLVENKFSIDFSGYSVPDKYKLLSCTIIYGIDSLSKEVADNLSSHDPKYRDKWPLDLYPLSLIFGSSYFDQSLMYQAGNFIRENPPSSILLPLNHFIKWFKKIIGNKYSDHYCSKGVDCWHINDQNYLISLIAFLLQKLDFINNISVTMLFSSIRLSSSPVFSYKLLSKLLDILPRKGVEKIYKIQGKSVLEHFFEVPDIDIYFINDPQSYNDERKFYLQPLIQYLELMIAKGVIDVNEFLLVFIRCVLKKYDNDVTNLQKEQLTYRVLAFFTKYKQLYNKKDLFAITTEWCNEFSTAHFSIAYSITRFLLNLVSDQNTYTNSELTELFKTHLLNCITPKTDIISKPFVESPPPRWSTHNPYDPYVYKDACVEVSLLFIERGANLFARIIESDIAEFFLTPLEFIVGKYKVPNIKSLMLKLMPQSQYRSQMVDCCNNLRNAAQFGNAVGFYIICNDGKSTLRNNIVLNLLKLKEQLLSDNPATENNADREFAIINSITGSLREKILTLIRNHYIKKLNLKLDNPEHFQSLNKIMHFVHTGFNAILMQDKSDHPDFSSIANEDCVKIFRVLTKIKNQIPNLKARTLFVKNFAQIVSRLRAIHADTWEKLLSEQLGFIEKQFEIVLMTTVNYPTILMNIYYKLLLAFSESDLLYPLSQQAQNSSPALLPQFENSQSQQSINHNLDSTMRSSKDQQSANDSLSFDRK